PTWLGSLPSSNTLVALESESGPRIDSVPGPLRPGTTLPEELVTAPMIVPLPTRVWPLTSVRPAAARLTSSVVPTPSCTIGPVPSLEPAFTVTAPALMNVLPEYVLAALKTSTPGLLLSQAPPPMIGPL